jgi:hypothetical protein
MKVVRFTVHEINANLKFLFFNGLALAVIALVLQIALMYLENSSSTIYQKATATEYQVSQYRNLVWLVNQGEPNEQQKKNLVEEFNDVLNTIEEFEIKFIQDHFKTMYHFYAIGRLEEYQSTMAYEDDTFMSDLRVYIETYRLETIEQSRELQEKVNIVNLGILFVLAALVVLFVYALIYARFGE